MEKPKIQFILKNRETYWGPDELHRQPTFLQSGVYNSAKFVVNTLNRTREVEAELIHVQDNNDIDRAVSRFHPDIVIIEAFWVVPEKFGVLARLHPTVKWVIRNHSEMAFAAQEGILLDWMIRYLQYPNVYVSGNSKNSQRDMGTILDTVYGGNALHSLLYLPNIYPVTRGFNHPPKAEDEYLDVACFGAIRPLKNHLEQAVASIEFAKNLGKKLRFHINGGRTEGVGSNEILKNLRMMFQNLPNGELIEHPWYTHTDFLDILKSMDIALQVSFSESFDIVAADAVHVGLPLVCSKEVPWSPALIHADPTSTPCIVRNMGMVWALRNHPIIQWICQSYLNHYSSVSLKHWLKMIHTLKQSSK